MIPYHRYLLNRMNNPIRCTKTQTAIIAALVE